MIAKEKFIDTLRFMSKKAAQENKLCTVLEEMSDDCGCANAFVYGEYSMKLLDLLRDSMMDKDDDIGYFLYELGGIDDVDIKVPEGQCPRWDDEVMYDSASSLYDYLARSRADE